MVARFVSGWRKIGKATSPKVPQRIAPRHAAILCTRPPEELTEEQKLLLDRIMNPVSASPFTKETGTRIPRCAERG